MTAVLCTADYSYAAALVDSFGKLGTRTAGETELPQITVQGKIPALPWLADLCGVKLIEITKGYTRHQCSEHCPEKHTPIASVTQRFQITGARATIALYTLQDYMRVQHVEARRLVELGRVIGYKTDVVNDMARLGWRLPELRDQPRARLELLR